MTTNNYSLEKSSKCSDIWLSIHKNHYKFSDQWFLWRFPKFCFFYQFWKKLHWNASDCETDIFWKCDILHNNTVSKDLVDYNIVMCCWTLWMNFHPFRFCMHVICTFEQTKRLPLCSEWLHLSTTNAVPLKVTSYNVLCEILVAPMPLLASFQKYTRNI